MASGFSPPFPPYPMQYFASCNKANLSPDVLVHVPGPLKLLTALLGVVYFLFLIFSDTFTAVAGKPSVHWAPGKALILSSLSIQILTFLNYKSMDIGSLKNLDSSNTNQCEGQTHLIVERVISNLLISGSGRLVICVFIGYLLPEMARPGSVKNWRNIVALVISLFMAVTSEFFYTPRLLALLQKFKTGSFRSNVKRYILEDGDTIAKMVRESSFILFVSVTLLVLLLVSAIIAGKTVRGRLSEKISIIQKESESSGERFECKPRNESCLFELDFYQPLKENEMETDTVVQIMYPSEPPIVCDYDWEFDDFEEFTDNLVEEEVLTEDQKDDFKNFLKQRVAEEKEKQNEAKEARKKAIEEMSPETKAAFANIRFYKFYPVQTPKTPDISNVKVPFINRYYGKATEVL